MRGFLKQSRSPVAESLAGTTPPPSPGDSYLRTSTKPESDSELASERLSAEPPQCKRLATTLIVRPMIIAPKRNDTRACRSATLRIRLDTRSVSETWNVSPMVNAT